MSDDAKLERIESKIDKLDTRIDRVDVTLAAQHVSLKEHMRRTSLLEQDLVPIKNHVAMVSAVFKIIGLVATVCGAIEGIVVLLTYLRK